MIIEAERESSTLDDAIERLKLIRENFPQHIDFFNDPEEYASLVRDLQRKFHESPEVIEEKFGGKPRERQYRESYPS